ncbi:DUF4459 domain-containing protein [Thorsellia anophelis]|uniref:YARHG domain-containing protein n=1 Tax=Thorsellia anophelis DSM 18579 TaxID=1123402 RepID=A0A1H9ZRJ7_9GAMM|nr:DUF4459 domain-containing protein [Thorsellia anophelis]SES84343.1 YARHG domain-containing protein [Thorsellia anophelis DSM 18579]
MNKFSHIILLFLLLNSGSLLAIDNYIIHFKDKPTEYHISDFEMWTDDIYNYEFTADEWLGIYANSEDAEKRYRVIPDVESIAYGKPWCNLQIFTGSIELKNIQNQNFSCIQILGQSKRSGEIPFGTKGLLIKHDGMIQFIPLLKQEILPGKYPEISRTEIYLQESHLLRANSSLNDMRIMLNEIYARYGYRFKPGGEMDRYFSTQSWYAPQYDNVDVFLTKTEKSNAKLLRKLLSPDVQNQKKRYIEEITAFCQALENDDLEYLSEHISYLTTGADQTVTFEQFKEILPNFKQVMLTSSANCAQDMSLLNKNWLFSPEGSNPFMNATFIYDEEEQKYLLVYFDLTQSCIPESSEIEVAGTLALKDYIDDSQDNKSIVRKIILNTVNMPVCITGADVNFPYWNIHVQLELSDSDEKKFTELANENVTLQGQVKLANSPQDYTRVKLINVTIKSIDTDKKSKAFM